MWYYIAPGVVLGIVTGVLIIYYCDEDFNPELKEEKEKQNEERKEEEK